MKKLLDLREVAAELSVGVGSLRRQSARGCFPPVLRVRRGEYRVERAAYDAWRASRWTHQEQARQMTALELADSVTGAGRRRRRRSLR